MRYLITLFLLTLSSIEIAYSQSTLLENVKRNPKEAIAFCRKFESLNSKGISSFSNEVMDEISLTKNLSSNDAQILTIYIIGMHCPEIY